MTTYTLYDEGGRWIGDYDGAGAVAQQAIWMGNAPVGLLVGTDATQSLKYVQPDHLGTPRSVIDPARNIAIWTWDGRSEAFGNSSPNQDPDMDDVSLALNMRHPGPRYDGASELHYNYFRDYDPRTGRYVQSDPIGLLGGVSTYIYGGGNPLGMIDPLGLKNYAACEVLISRGNSKIRKEIALHGWAGPLMSRSLVRILIPMSGSTMSIHRAK